MSSTTEQSISEQSPPQKIGVLLLNMGGPDKLESVKPFLFNLFSDPDIIKLPLSFLLQKLLAWVIVTARGKEAMHNYAKMGGASPQLRLTQAQADSLKQCLEQDFNQSVSVYIGMRYWHPFTEEALDQIEADQIDHLIVLSMYPHFSYTTTGSSLNELRRQMAKRNMSIPMSVIGGYYQDPNYLRSVAGCIQEGLDTHPWDCPKENVQLLFSAHSLPLSHVKRMRDPYPDLIFKCIQTIAETHFPDNSWDICYQSKVGKMPWLGPYTDSALRYYAAKKMNNILMIPISFVTDHIETLVEIDDLYIGLAKELGIINCYRAPALNSRPAFITTLANLVYHKILSRTQSFSVADKS